MKIKFLICYLSALLCLPAIALATIIGSSHDIAAALGNTGLSTCSYCHSVHNSTGGAGRAAYLGGLPTVTAVYASSSIKQTITTTTVNNSDAPLCLSCHDYDTIVTRNTDVAGKIGSNSPRDIKLDLSNDHPVGFKFDPLKYTNNEFRTFGVGHPDLMKFGPARDEMWCSGCHNVHGGISGTKLLRVNIVGSELCLYCHNR